jgi:thiol:disulfide interchange protein DsbD
MSRVLAALALLGAGNPAARAVPSGWEKFKELPNRIEFQVAIAPEDPFAEANKLGDARKEYRRGDVVQLIITGKPRPGFYTYPITQRTAQQLEVALSGIRYAESNDFKLLPPVRESAPKLVTSADPIIGDYLKLEGPFTWTQDVLIAEGAEPGPRQLRFSVVVQVCDDKGCEWGKFDFAPTIDVSSQPPVPLTAELKARLAAPTQPVQVIGPPARTGPGGPPGAGATDSSLLGFILSGAVWGAISLLTPCVFPMIPITVSFFLKQSEKTHHRPVAMALVYCLTIVTVLTVGAVLLLGFFQAAIYHWLTNVLLGGLFIFFALSLFGMYDITLPSGLARFTSAREGQGGLVGTIFMALTFSIISFSCVAPFMGAFAALTPKLDQVTTMIETGQWGDLGYVFGKLTLGALAFAVTFAAPFFFLALFPRLLKAMPQSGSWMNTIKVVMGFIEVAAAIKFLRAGEVLAFRQAHVLTYDLALGMYVALALGCGLYLLNGFRLPHDEPQEHLGVPRMIFGVLFVSLGLYLLPGLFKVNAEERQRPRGTVFAWLESFLLPDSTADWIGNFDKGLKEAREKGRLIFIDFTGQT